MTYPVERERPPLDEGMIRYACPCGAFVDAPRVCADTIARLAETVGCRCGGTPVQVQP